MREGKRFVMETQLQPSSQASPGDENALPGNSAGNARAGRLWRRMLTLTARSLPAYLHRARPWVPGRFADLWEAMQEIAEEHREFAAKAAEHIVRSGEVPDPGNYPDVYTAWHDLSLDFLADKMIRELRNGAAELESAADPRLAPAAAKSAESLRRLFLDEAERLQSLLDDLRKESPAAPSDAA
ncbi:MAG: hypothetical protein Kow0040_08210 [Thermogutta sp.]